ncbi:UDP-N-acetylmuramate:L-alanyl-gamma-D-glutamyl-meso-diaminopimelate ligase [Desulfatirhabdium butyrativorans]|uniref:UDP-N-acetylmuramate:L-alanyl-gamma-D-glutamyl- meso-diaminopimelate ligase n=1 Tax=Desulfatirhabdium butyrativorans TaxID=340467 RepID=UPI0003FA5B89|nr:UDP-N-acetylmuramate:L-alanyl-gamma-D-glutamyl-meso-diaminopimelate ligase [Desulfatirhabdium butyrativorans]
MAEADILNFIPDRIGHVHFIAVCGTAMAAVACLMKEMGYRVSGSDTGVYPPISTFLADRGIEILPGYEPSHLDDRPDLVVVGNAVSRTNVEVLCARALGIPYCSMPQAIRHFAIGDKQALVVCGTHGKTTTSSLIAWILQDAGLDPSFIVGGIVRGFDSNYRLGKGSCIVLEGDEYDTAYFDKHAKFLHYPAYRAVITSIEYDHADIFPDIGSIRSAFSHFLDRVPPEGRVFAFDTGEHLDAVLAKFPGDVERYGTKASSAWRLENLRSGTEGTTFDAVYRGSVLGTFGSPLMGRHNAWNALSAIALTWSLGLPVPAIQSALRTFPGVRRRQEVRGVVKGITVMDDFAHHPTAIRETLQAVRSRYPAGRLIAIFEPGTHTSMRAVFQDVFPAAFADADLILLRAPSRIAKVPEAERISVEKLVADLASMGKPVRLFADTQAVVDEAVRVAKPSDVLLVMSNGGFENIHERLMDALRGA